MGLAEFAGWLATQVFDVVGSFAGVQGADGGATVDLQVGKTVFHDVPKQMRSELWLSQLQRKGPHGGAPTQGDFYDLLFETSKLPPEVLSDIEKDTHRTFPGHPRLSTPEGHKALLNVLSAYALSDPEIGYTQGMNFLAGVLLTWLPSEADAFAALSLLMRQRGLREMYLPDMSLLQVRLWQLSKLLPPALGAHLEAHAVLPVLYASSWLLTCFAADFPLHFAGRVMDVLLTQGHQVASPVLKVAVAIVQRCEADLLRTADFEEMVYYLRQEVPQWTKTQLQELLTDALSKPWSARQLRVLDQINGAETVMEAVSRVNKLVTLPTPEAAEVAAALGFAASGAAPAPAPAAAAPTGAAVGSQQQQQQQQQRLRQRGQPEQQLSPRTFAKSLSSGFAPALLPPPPVARAGKPAVSASSASAAAGKPEAPAWEAFASAELQTLAELETQRVRIDMSVAEDLDVLQLGPQLSQALSCYAQPGAASGSGSSAAAAAGVPAAASPLPPPAAAGAAAGPAQPQYSAAQAGSGAAGEGPAAAPGRQRGAEARHAQWDAFAGDASRTLQEAVPSPFQSQPVPRSTTLDPRLLGPQPVDAARAGSGTALPAPSNSAPSLPAAGAAAAAAAAAAAQRGPAAASPQPPSAAPSYGSFQLGTLTSAAPLVDAPGGHAGGAAPSPVHGLLGLFCRSDASRRAASASGDDDGCTGSDLQDAPSSTGSSLAAVLQQLGLSEAGSGAAHLLGAPGPGGDRRLRHSSELEDFGSFKTAVGPPSEASDSSWHSVAARELRRQSTGLSSTASSSLPGLVAGRTAPVAGCSAEPAAPARPASPALQRVLRLSSDEASLRAGSLQEQALVGFLASGKKDAAAAAQRQQRQQSTQE